MNILSKIMPLERIIAIATKLGLLAKPMHILAQGWSKAQGYRTQVLLVGAGLLAAAASLGFVPWEVVDEPIKALLGAAGAAFLDKWNRVAPTVKSVAQKVSEQG